MLAIETSCDETSIAIVDVSESRQANRREQTKKRRGLVKTNPPRFTVLENLVSSQIKIHAPYGGVVPSLAKREHLKNLPILYRKIFGKEQIANRTWKNIDLITVTVGPGLEPALWTGIEFAKKLAAEYKKPLVGANHMEGHLYSFLLPKKTEISNSQFLISKKSKTKKLPVPSRVEGKPISFPAIALLVSGGHTILLVMKSLTQWKKLGETRDDAVGEAFDKVARILGLPYPGGPELERLARQGNKNAIPFPRPMLHQKNYDFSFSGLKTSVLYYVRDTNILMRTNDTNNTNKKGGRAKTYNLLAQSGVEGTPKTLLADIAASFQQAVIDVLVKKTMRAANEYGARSLILAGGVAANKPLRKTLASEAKSRDITFFAPDMAYNGDNAAMIAAAAYMRKTARKKTKLLVANGNLNI